MSTGRASRAIRGAVVAALLAIGCSRDDSTVSVTEAVVSTLDNANEAQRVAEAFAEDEGGRGGGPRAQTARDRVAQARCDRMAACGAIAPGSRYESRDSCVSGELDRVESWWGRDCDAMASAVDACIADVAGDFCPASLDRPFVGNAGDCSPTSVCSKGGTPR